MSVLKWFPLTGRGEGGLQAQESGGGGQKIQGGHQGVKESRGVKNSGCRKFWGMKMSGGQKVGGGVKKVRHTNLKTNIFESSSCLCTSGNV